MTQEHQSSVGPRDANRAGGRILNVLTTISIFVCSSGARLGIARVEIGRQFRKGEIGMRKLLNAGAATIK